MKSREHAQSNPFSRRRASVKARASVYPWCMDSRCSSMAASRSPVGLGKGTVVDLWFPVSSVGAGEHTGSHGAVARRPGLGTALLVDDEEMVRLSTADMLMDLGYEVVEAGSGEEALRLIDGGLDPDLVVTDHLMPGMTGEELARTLRINRPELPLLIISGYAEEIGMDSSLARLTKPFRNAELTASLAALPAFLAGNEAK
jgi:CheY-like chemotaxis protein